MNIFFKESKVGTLINKGLLHECEVELLKKLSMNSIIDLTNINEIIMEKDSYNWYGFGMSASPQFNCTC